MSGVAADAAAMAVKCPLANPSRNPMLYANEKLFCVSCIAVCCAGLGMNSRGGTGVVCWFAMFFDPFSLDGFSHPFFQYILY